VSFVLPPPALADGKKAGAGGQRPGDDPGYVGSEICQTCHESQYRTVQKTRMGKIMFKAPRTPLEAKGCEACHGPARSHVDLMTGTTSNGNGQGNGTTASPEPALGGIIRFGKNSALPAAEQNAVCLECHQKGMQLFWKGSPHESRGLTCVTCHQVMHGSRGESRFLEPLAENRLFVKDTQMEVCFQCHQMRRAQLMRSAHMPFREGKVTCTNCHNPHGTPNPKQLIESTTNENCYKCHTERRGPFLWEHPPVMEDCMNCHEAHGSSNPQLLKVRTPRLCQRCHIETRHPTTPQLPTTRFAFNRSCTNCHSQIHGSNHPAGVRFQR
jgi:DmsE family decaheme c-type cytochrome